MPPGSLGPGRAHVRETPGLARGPPWQALAGPVTRHFGREDCAACPAQGSRLCGVRTAEQPGEGPPPSSGLGPRGLLRRKGLRPRALGLGPGLQPRVVGGSLPPTAGDYPGLTCWPHQQTPLPTPGTGPSQAVRVSRGAALEDLGPPGSHVLGCSRLTGGLKMPLCAPTRGSALPSPPPALSPQSRSLWFGAHQLMRPSCTFPEEETSQLGGAGTSLWLLQSSGQARIKA